MAFETSRHDTAPLPPQRTDKHLQKASLRQAGRVPTLARGPFLRLESRVSFHPIARAGLLLGIACTTAHAGQFANGHWASNACGPRPEAPAVNGKDDKTYNASVEAANAYLPRLRDHLDCVIKEANADLQAVTQGAQTAQQSAAASREQLIAELKAAEGKLK